MIGFKDQKVTIMTTKSGNKIEAEFPYTGDEDLLRIQTSCDCIKAQKISGSQVISMKFTVPKVPEYLKYQGNKHLTQMKSITVYFKDTPPITLSCVYNIIL